MLLCLQNFAISFNVAALSATIPTISPDLGLSDIAVSKIIPYYMIPYGVGALFYAPLARKISAKTIMAVTMFVFALTNFFCASVTSLNQFLFLRILMGVVSAGVVPLGLMTIGKLFDYDVRGRMVGIFFSSSFFASIAGLLLSGFTHWRWLFGVPAFLGLLAAMLIILFVYGLPALVEAKVNYRRVFQDPQIQRVFIFITLMSTLYHGVDRWLGVYFHRAYGLKQLTISSLFILIAVSAAAGQLLGGLLTDKKGRLFSCRLGLLMLSCATMLLSQVFPMLVLVLILIIFAAGWTIGHNGVSTALTDFPDKNRSEIASLNSSLRFIGGGLGFSVSAIFVQKSFGLTFLGIGAAMLFLSVFLKKVIPQTKSATAKSAKLNFND